MNHVYKNKRDLIDHVVRKSDVILDIGFWGQGVLPTDPAWAHRQLCDNAKAVYGVDLELDLDVLKEINDVSHYRKQSAESFSFPSMHFNIIVALDLIEHLSNPGLFLDAAKSHLAPGGRLIVTTPNAFNLFTIAGKLTRKEPATNSDHTCYFNETTITTLLKKNGWKVETVDYLYSLDIQFKESLRKKALDVLYKLLCLFTSKYCETLVITAVPI